MGSPAASISGAPPCAIASAQAVGDGERGSAVNLSGFAQIFGEKRGLTDRQAREKYEQPEQPETYSLRIEREEDRWSATVSYENVEVARFHDAGKQAAVGRACKSIRKHVAHLGK